MAIIEETTLLCYHATNQFIMRSAALQSLFDINPEFKNKKNIVIFGTGRMGLLTLTVMLQEDIYITAFCDKNSDLWNLKIMNKPVISPDDLIEMKDNSAVIVAEDDIEACYSYLQDLGIKDIWVDKKMYSIINDCVWDFV
jgi:FlaA1/EpsC-like NDP-sugar epimerase